MLRILTLATFLMLRSTTLSADELPTVEAVLDRFIQAVGGAEVLDCVSERRYRGVIIQDLSWTDPQHRETPFLASGDAEGNVRYAEVSDWADLSADDATNLRSKLRWIFHPQFALVVEEFFPGLRVDRREVREDRNVIVLVPRDLKPEHFSLYFDGRSGLLSHIGYHNWLKDWREVDGVRYPHRWVFGRKGGHTTYVWEEIATVQAPRLNEPQSSTGMRQ